MPRLGLAPSVQPPLQTHHSSRTLCGSPLPSGDSPSPGPPGTSSPEPQDFSTLRSICPADQTHFCLRAFAHPVPLARMPFSHLFIWLWSLHLPGHSSVFPPLLRTLPRLPLMPQAESGTLLELPLLPAPWDDYVGGLPTREEPDLASLLCVPSLLHRTWHTADVSAFVERTNVAEISPTSSFTCLSLPELSSPFLIP